jgi:hypothetical protein
MFSKLKRLLASVIPRRARKAEQKILGLSIHVVSPVFDHSSYALAASSGSILAAQSDLSLLTVPLSDGLGYDADDASHFNRGNHEFSLYGLRFNRDDEENNGLSGPHAYSSSFYAGSSASLLSDARFSYSRVGFDYHRDTEGQSDHQESNIYELRDIAIRNLLYRVSIIRQLNSVGPMSALEDSLSFNVPPPFNKDIGLGHWLAPFFGSQQVLVRVEQILGVVPQM